MSANLPAPKAKNTDIYLINLELCSQVATLESIHHFSQGAFRVAIHPINVLASKPVLQPTSILLPVKLTSSLHNQPPSSKLSKPSTQPSRQQSTQSSPKPSGKPSSQSLSLTSSQPSCQPAIQPSSQPGSQPSSHPSAHPNSKPSDQPSSWSYIARNTALKSAIKSTFLAI